VAWGEKQVATKSKARAAPDKLALVEKLVATDPSIERKGEANLYDAMSGHMFRYRR
jgi:hypothetical protein